MEQLKHLENRDLGNNCCPVMKTPLSNECCWLVMKFCLSALFFAFHSSFAEDSETQFSEKAVPIIKDGTPRELDEIGVFTSNSFDSSLAIKDDTVYINFKSSESISGLVIKIFIFF